MRLMQEAIERKPQGLSIIYNKTSETANDNITP
jgi:hypothetical protein